MFRGCMVALVTPFRRGQVDFRKLDELVDFHLAKGTDVIVPCGTTGESPTLDFDEHEKVIEAVVKRAKGRVPVLAGTGANSTSEAVRLTTFAERAGADGALLVTPYYNKPEPDGMYEHFKAISRAVKFPLVLYNIPSRTGRSIDAATVARLSKLKNIVGIKEASGSTDQSSEIRTLCGIDIYSGDDSMTLPLLSIGGKGIISVVANIVPRDIKAMIKAFTEGNVKKAERLHLKLFPLCRAMFIETNPIPVKTAMRLLGMLNGEMRLPLSPMRQDKVKTLRKALVNYGLL